MLSGFINDRIRATVLPRCSEVSDDTIRGAIKDKEILEKVDIAEFVVKTEDGTELSTFRIEPKTKDSKAIQVLHLLGNSQTVAAAIDDLVEISLINQCHITTFHYRGVSGSKGRALNINDVFKDCIAQVENLFKNGVKAKNLIISGFSLGGGLATKVVSHYHQLGKKVYLFNDRSFGRLSDVAAAWYGNPLRVVFRKLLRFFDWEIDADKFYLQIPSKYKRHINLVGADDEVVPFYVSLSKRLKDMKQKVSDEFLFFCVEGYQQRGHKAPLRKIINKYGETGEKILSKFIEEIRNQVGKK